MTKMPDEKARLKTLHRYDILDTAPEAAYDGLIRLAAVLCDAPAAVVALWDADRVWFKSALGVPVRQVRAASAIAAGLHAAAEHEAVQREDPSGAWRGLDADEAPSTGARRGIASDGDTWGNPFRFCAGAPLVTQDGCTLGVLAVLDTAIRPLSEERREALQTLARQVMAHLELRHNTRELADTVAELREAEKTIRYMAYHDALTGLPGRLLFHDRLTHALKHAQRYGETVAVMFLDLDGFKSVNDTWGHATGDRLLVSVAARLTGALRKSDTVARIGGDEFAVICPDIHGEENAKRVAGKLLATFENPLPVDGIGLSITASIGIALYPLDGATPESLLVDADTAMYRAKRNGKNSYALSAIASCKSCICG